MGTPSIPQISATHFPKTRDRQGVYLIHLDTPLAHAQHYIGFAFDIHQRVQAHSKGQGARMLQVCVERGITFRLARTWQGMGRTWERRLKNRRNARILCPVCNPTAENYPTQRRPKDAIPCPF